MEPQSQEHILQFFAFAHLPPHLAEVSRPFGEMAQRIVDTLPRNPERNDLRSHGKMTDMLSPNDHDELHNPKAMVLDDETITTMIDDRIKATSSLPIRVTIPRHSIDRASVLATNAGWTTEISTVRSIEVDSPDMLILSHRTLRR